MSCVICNSCNCLCEDTGFKRLKVLNLFANTNSMDWQAEFFRDRNKDAAAGGTIKLGGSDWGSVERELPDSRLLIQRLVEKEPFAVGL